MMDKPLTIIGSASKVIGNEACPIYIFPVQAGWPSPAEDYIESRINLHKHFQIENALPAAKAEGHHGVQARFTRALSADVGVFLHFDFVKSQNVIALDKHIEPKFLGFMKSYKSFVI